MLGKGYQPESVWYQHIYKTAWWHVFLPASFPSSPINPSSGLFFHCCQKLSIPPDRLSPWASQVPSNYVSLSRAAFFIHFYSNWAILFLSIFRCLIRHTESKTDSFPFPKSVSEAVTGTKRAREVCIFALANLYRNVNFPFLTKK